MKKTISYLTIVLFLVLCILPSAGMLILGESGAAANEILSAAPRLHDRDGRFNPQVLNDTADYIADRFALRQQFVTAWAKLHTALFHSSAEDQILLGENDWLFYTATLDDYAGQHLRAEELDRIVENLSAAQRYVESQGKQFLFTVAPNKNSLYPEYMASRYTAAHEQSNIRLLEPRLQEAGIHYVDLFSLYGGEPVRYYETDSHWTAQGAAMAADRLLAAMDRSGGYAAGPFAENGTHPGDLYEMLYPAAEDPETQIDYAGELNYTTRSDPKGGEAITIESDRSGADGSLLCWRDSFGIALYPYLADSFGHALFSRSAAYDFTRFDLQDYDVVLIEIVERNLPQLAADCVIFPTD